MARARAQEERRARKAREPENSPEDFPQKENGRGKKRTGGNNIYIILYKNINIYHRRLRMSGVSLGSYTRKIPPLYIV